MKKISIFLTFFIILAPVVEAVPIIEIFVDEVLHQIKIFRRL